MSDILEEEIIDEHYIVAEEEVIGEGENAKKQICFKGIFSEADSLNRNKRVYPKAVLREAYENAIRESKETGKPIFGEWKHGNTAQVDMDQIAVTFPELYWNEEKGQIFGKAIPTLMEAGEKVKKLSASGFPICFSTKMAGKVKPMTEERKHQLNITEDCVEVMPGARLISIDVVYNNSCQKAVSETVYEETEIKEEVNHNPTFKQVFDSLIN